MGGGGKAAAGTVAAATIYTGGRIATNALTIGQAFITAAAQIAAQKWMIDRQESLWDHVANKQIKAVEVAVDQFVRSIDDMLPTFAAAYPDVPEAARFVAVSPQQEHWQQMVDNIANGPKTAEYMVYANHWHRINHQARVELLSPGFTVRLAAHMKQVEALMNGQLPPDELIALTTDDAENAAAMGRLGNTRNITAASIGVRKLQLQHLGREEFSRHAEILQRISPVEGEVTMDSLMLKPQNRLAFALEQAQLLQNDLQNFNNQKAQKPPHLMAELQTKLQRTVTMLTFMAQKASMGNQFVPNFQAAYMPIVSKLMEGVTNAFSWEKSPDSAQDLGGHLTPTSAISAT